MLEWSVKKKDHVISLWTLDTSVVPGQVGYPTVTLFYYWTLSNRWKHCGWSEFVAMEFRFYISSLTFGNAPPGVTILDTCFHFELLSLIQSPFSSTAMVDLVFYNSPNLYFIVLLSWCISQLTFYLSSDKCSSILVAAFCV